jgi:hypothetical protein
MVFKIIVSVLEAADYLAEEMYHCLQNVTVEIL